jgi:hypothetical protein
MLAPAAPTLTEETTPGPGVEVYFPTLDAAGATITVWRVADGSREAVRGAKRATVSGDFVITDWEIPFGVVSTYVGELFDASGASVLGGSSAITVDRDDVYISNPVDPEQVYIVNLEAASFGRIQRTRRTEQVLVMGVQRPFEQNWGLGGIESLPFTLWTETVSDSSKIDLLLQSSPLLIRTPPRFSTLPRSLSASIKQPEQTPFDWRANGTTIVWSLVVDEVQPIGKAIIRPLITWDDWMAAFPTAQATWSGTVGASTSTTPALAGVTVINRALNPSGEQNTTGYVAVPGTTGVAVMSNPGITGNTRQGLKAIRATWSTASTAAGGGITYDSPVTAGQILSVGFGRVRSSIGNRLQLSIEWRTASATISTVTATAVQVTAGTIYDETTFKLENQTAPATATVARVKLLSVAGTGYANWSIGAYLETKLLMINLGATLGRPFDGDTVFGATWDDVSAVYGAGTWTDAQRTGP